MQKSRRLLPYIPFLAALVVGAVAGYYVKGFQVWASEFGRPAVYEDVSDAILQKFGAPFARPPGARNVVAAGVGNGGGDVVWYAALEVPEKQAAALLNDLKARGEIRLARHVPEAYYLEQLTPELARRLWPADKISKTHTYISRKGYVAYVPDDSSIHIYGWPQVETEFNEPAAQGGVSNSPAPQAGPRKPAGACTSANPALADIAERKGSTVRGPLSVEDLERDNTIQVRETGKPLPFGEANAAWLAFKAAMLPGDEIYFITQSEKGGYMDGHVLVRSGCVIRVLAGSVS